MSRLARLAAAHGVAVAHSPAPGRTADVPADTIVAVLAALGVDASTPRALREALEAHEQDGLRLLPPTVVLRAGSGRSTLPQLPEGTLLHVGTEDGDSLDWGPGGLLPLGVHTLRARTPDGRAGHATLLVVPDRLPAPPGRTAQGRSFGLLLQLYSLISDRSWGMGDLGDLTDLADWAGRAAGAGFVQLGPLHAALPGTPTDPSPYRPSSRRFPDPVHLRIEDVPEFAYLDADDRARMRTVLERATALRDGVLHKDVHIDRDASWALKREALEILRRVPLVPGRHAAYCDYLAEGGQALEDHATWCALAEEYGPRWRDWPPGLDDPRSARTARARDSLMDRVDFHCRLAWLADEQLARAQHTARRAGMPVGLVHDLAVGVHPDGADTWAHRDVFAQGVSVGAPPDAFNPRGQDWGLPPWRPDMLAESGYAAFREVLTGLLRHSGALRIDHVMGLFRLWWVPEGRPATEGTYVRYDAEAMLGVLALEAHRAQAAVIGEDLGTVEPGVREELADRGVLGTSVLWFEKDYAHAPGHSEAAPLDPEHWRADCLATATTHDLPPTAARLSGEHVALRDRLGLLAQPLRDEQNAATVETTGWLDHFRHHGVLPEGAEGGEEACVKAVHRFLARTPARMVGVWLPDAVGDRRPQNVPGTRTSYPNWRLPVSGPDGRPMSWPEVAASPRAHDLFEELRRGLGQE